MLISEGTICGLLTMIGFGMGNALSRVPAHEIGPLKTLFYRGVFITLMQLALLAFWFPVKINFYGVILAIGVAIFGYFPVMFFYKALSLGRVGIVVPIANTSAVVTTILAVIFFKENFTSGQAVSTLIIIIGISLISVDLKDFKESDLLRIESGVPYALAACILWGILFVTFKFPVAKIGPIFTSFFVELGIMIMSFCHIKIRKESISLPVSYLQYIFPISIFCLVAGISYNIGISTSAISTVIILYMANPVVSTLYARIFYREKLNLQQYVGVVVSIAGLIGFSMLRQ